MEDRPFCYMRSHRKRGTPNGDQAFSKPADRGRDRPKAVTRRRASGFPELAVRSANGTAVSRGTVHDTIMIDRNASCTG